MAGRDVEVPRRLAGAESVGSDADGPGRIGPWQIAEIEGPVPDPLDRPMLARPRDDEIADFEFLHRYLPMHRQDHGT